MVNGGDVVSEDGKENNLNSEANIKTLEWIQDLVLNENVSPQGLKAADADTMFQSGQLAMYTSGPWNINGLKNSWGLISELLQFHRVQMELMPLKAVVHI